MLTKKKYKIVQLENAIEQRMQILKTLFIQNLGYEVKYVGPEFEYLSKSESVYMCVCKLISYLHHENWSKRFAKLLSYLKNLELQCFKMSFLCL